MEQNELRVWLINKLKDDMPGFKKLPMPKDEQGQKDLLRSMMNLRMPRPMSEAFLQMQDVYFKRENMLKGIVDERTLEPCAKDQRLYIWQGDITRLGVDAIVNAANSGMTGCYEPLHNCIDNCIHTYAGMRLRLECARIMNRQGHDEPTGQAKITPGYCLPAKYILHTVGPIVYGDLTDSHRELLRSSYRSCLRLAEENKLESVAFCCISTGVFMFPAEEAAHIAVETVKEYLDEQAVRYGEVGSCISIDHQNPKLYKGIQRVIFNVFSDRDRMIYDSILN